MRLEDLQTNATVRGIRPDSAVTVVSTQWHGSDVVALVYRDANRFTHKIDIGVGKNGPLDAGQAPPRFTAFEIRRDRPAIGADRLVDTISGDSSGLVAATEQE